MLQRKDIKILKNKSLNTFILKIYNSLCSNLLLSNKKLLVVFRISLILILFKVHDEKFQYFYFFKNQTLHYFKFLENDSEIYFSEKLSQNTEFGS